MKQHLHRKCIKAGGVYLSFYTLKEKKFLHRNFFSSVFGAVQTQIVGKTGVFRQSRAACIFMQAALFIDKRTITGYTLF